MEFPDKVIRGAGKQHFEYIREDKILEYIENSENKLLANYYENVKSAYDTRRKRFKI